MKKHMILAVSLGILLLGIQSPNALGSESEEKTINFENETKGLVRLNLNPDKYYTIFEDGKIFQSDTGEKVENITVGPTLYRVPSIIKVETIRSDFQKTYNSCMSSKSKEDFYQRMYCFHNLPPESKKSFSLSRQKLKKFIKELAEAKQNSIFTITIKNGNLKIIEDKKK